MIRRLIAKNLTRLASQYPVITITGPRQSGKTTLCKALFPKYGYANLEALDTRQLAITDPRGFLAKYTDGVILDEVQRAPELTSYIQELVDAKEESGKFILTGSQQFEILNTINQSLAGRSAILKLMPLAYEELYSQQEMAQSIEEILYTGFYPRIHSQHLNPTEALSFYLNTYVERDIRQLINIKDLLAFEKFMRICATQIGQLVNYSQIANDVGVAQNTIKSWLSILQASYIIFILPPHFSNFRKRMTKSAKLYFYDVGLASYLLGIENPGHVASHPLKGQLFENFIISEFLKNRYNNIKEKNLYFYRDHIGNEVDLILDYGNKLISVEIKSGKTVNNDYFKGLKFYQSLASKLNASSYVVYGGDTSYLTHEIPVYSYKNFHQLFKKLPS
jgi:predicted AAA+ superfamily ATPase